MPKVVEPQIPNYPPQGIQAQLDLLYLWNPDAANELIKQLEELIKEVQSNLDYNKLVNKPTLNTTSTNALVAGTEEVAGVVKLHKVSKTGSYEDLNDKPDLDLYATKTALAAGLGSKADLSTVNTIRTDLDDLGDQVHEIEAKVPAAATTDNQLADKAFVNSSINAVAAYYITSTPEGDSFATKADLDKGPYYFQGAVRVPTTNDYALVKADETHEGSAARYMYDGKQWDYQYTLNDTPFTQAQVDAINSGITAGLVTKYNAAADTVDALDSEVGTLKTEMATAQSDIGALKTASNTQAGLISDLQNDKADKTALPQNQTGTAGQVYTKTDAGAEWQDASGGSSLPDQTGNAGKFLTTDGTNASWSDKPLVNNSTAKTSLSIGESARADNTYNLAIGPNSAAGTSASAKSIYNLAIGVNSAAGSSFGSNYSGCVAIGHKATARGISSALISTAVDVYRFNDENNTFAFANQNGTYQIINATGFIPSERLASDGTTGQVLSKTDTGMEWKSISAGGGTNAGIKGDYFATWGWTEGDNGLPTIVSGSNNIKTPAGIVMMCPGADGYITFTGEMVYENELTEDFTLFYARNTDGTGATLVGVTDVVWSDTEPEPNGQSGFQAWKKSGSSTWQLRSNDTGNTWREVVGGPIADIHYTDGNATRIDFDGYRQFNKQQYVKFASGSGAALQDWIPVMKPTTPNKTNISIGGERLIIDNALGEIWGSTGRSFCSMGAVATAFNTPLSHTNSNTNLGCSMADLSEAITPIQEHIVIEFQAPTADNNYTWYRKYKDGWVEQGGIATTNGGDATPITLPIEMVDANYIPFMQGRTGSDGYSGAGWQVMPVNTSTSTQTSTQFYAQASITGYDLRFGWQVNGMYKKV